MAGVLSWAGLFLRGKPVKTTEDTELTESCNELA